MNGTINDTQSCPFGSTVAVRTVGELPPGDPTFEGLDLDLAGPVQVKGQLQATGDGEPGPREIRCQPGQEPRRYAGERQRLIGAEDALERVTHRAIRI